MQFEWLRTQSVFLRRFFLSVLKMIRGQPIFILILKYRKDLLVTSRHPHITNSTQENAFEKLIFGHVVNKLSYFTEPESSLPCSKEPPLAPILSRFNPTHFILHHIYSSLILIQSSPFVHWSPKWFSFRNSRQKNTNALLLSLPWCMYRSSQCFILLAAQSPNILY